MKKSCIWQLIFLSTLSLRRATRSVQSMAVGAAISIHALLAESDRGRARLVLCQGHFYPRSPCGERRMGQTAGRTTCYFYPRSPCGERLLPSWDLYQMLRISIHALLAESDLMVDGHRVHITRFLSTLSLRRATSCLQKGKK